MTAVSFRIVRSGSGWGIEGDSEVSGSYATKETAFEAAAAAALNAIKEGRENKHPSRRPRRRPRLGRGLTLRLDTVLDETGCVDPGSEGAVWRVPGTVSTDPGQPLLAVRCRR
jgi:hypothetical protein